MYSAIGVWFVQFLYEAQSKDILTSVRSSQWSSHCWRKLAVTAFPQSLSLDPLSIWQCGSILFTSVGVLFNSVIRGARVSQAAFIF